MSDFDAHAHWDRLYKSKQEDKVSWFEESPTVSLDLIAACGVAPDAAMIDVGGGASRLVDALLERGYSRLSVLDLSEAAIAVAKARLGDRAAHVRWIVADVRTWRPAETYELWHDRAAFHFLTAREDQLAYVERLRAALRPGGHAIIGTFAPSGPERCSGLPVARHDAASLSHVLGAAFELVEWRPWEHRTPTGAIQQFQFSRFRRVI